MLSGRLLGEHSANNCKLKLKDCILGGLRKLLARICPKTANFILKAALWEAPERYGPGF